MNARSKCAFVKNELLPLMVILAILAAIIVPTFVHRTRQPKSPVHSTTSR